MLHSRKTIVAQVVKPIKIFKIKLHIKTADGCQDNDKDNYQNYEKKQLESQDCNNFSIC